MLSIEDSSQKDLLKICIEHLEVTVDMLQCKVFPSLDRISDGMNHIVL